MPTPTPTLSLPQQWQDIAAEYARTALSDAIAELHQIDENMDYSFEQTMIAIACDHGRDTSPEIGVQNDTRIALRTRKYEILRGLFTGLGERKRRTQEG